jgi:hypothetical protein
MLHDKDGGEILKRPLGRTGLQISALGVVGHHIGDFKTVEEEIQLVREAVDSGITFYGKPSPSFMRRSTPGQLPRQRLGVSRR